MFGLDKVMMILSLPKIWTLLLIVGSAMSVNKSWISEELKMINLKLNPNEPI